jgi:hypothetical protein
VREKLVIIAYAEEHGNRAAGRHYRVDESLVRSWREHKQLLEATPRDKKITMPRGGHAKWPELEEELDAWVTEERTKHGREVSTVAMRLKAQQIAQRRHLSDFTGGIHWLENFMRRYGIRIRMRTTVGHHLPPDYEQQIARFKEYVQTESAGVRLKNVINLDETSCQFDMPRGRTADRKGAKEVKIATTGREHSSYTVVLAASSDGRMLKPMIIFKRATVPNEHFPPGVVVKSNPKGWMTEDIFTQWVDEILLSRPNAPVNPSESLFIMDAAKPHLTPKSKGAIEEYAKLAVVPARLTRFVQPLDISVNAVFKNHMRSHWEEFMRDESKHTYTPSGKMRAPSYAEIARWVKESADSVKPETIRRGFQHIMNPSDSEVEHVLTVEHEHGHDDFIEEPPTNDLSGIPNEYVEAIDSFEAINGDEFDGFGE